MTRCVRTQSSAGAGAGERTGTSTGHSGETVSSPITKLAGVCRSETPRRGQCAQIPAISGGTGLAVCPFVINFFMAGPEMVRWELTAVESNGPYRLTVHHAQGVIVEYFETSAAALMRQQELEDLLIAARGMNR
jgi:hypothetical protein